MSWSNPQNLPEKLARAALMPASLVYGGISRCRAMVYKSLGKSRQFKATVLSVGNITCGGTGKTPITMDFAQSLIAQGKRVGILSRGYRRRSTAPYVVVSDGRGHFASCADSGDEPLLMAMTVPDAVVIVGAKRTQTAEIAIKHYGCDTLLLDDGFQHLAVARDCDIVLLDYNDDIWNQAVLPAGSLREPLRALSRAHRIVITKLPETPDMERIKQFKQVIRRFAPKAQVDYCRMVTTALVPIHKFFAGIGKKRNADALNGAKVLAVSGIATPESFAKQLEGHGAKVAAKLAYPDHHWYTTNDIKAIFQEAKSIGAEFIVTTPKDAVKLKIELPSDRSLPENLMVLSQAVEWVPEPGVVTVQPSLVTS